MEILFTSESPAVIVTYFFILEASNLSSLFFKKRSNFSKKNEFWR